MVHEAVDECGGDDRVAEEAARLGWELERIVVVDADLGVAGRDAHTRESYSRSRAPAPQPDRRKGEP